MQALPTAILIWLSAHRIVVIAFFAVLFWIAAYYWYFNNQITRWWRRNAVRPWEVDLVNRKSRRGKIYRPRS